MLDPALREGLIEPPRLLLHLGVKVYFLDNDFERGEKRLGFCAILLESQRQTSGVDNSVTCAEFAAHRNRVDGLDPPSLAPPLPPSGEERYYLHSSLLLTVRRREAHNHMSLRLLDPSVECESYLSFSPTLSISLSHKRAIG